MSAATGPEPAGHLHINWTRCDGRGICTELLPSLLIRDDWGYPLAADPELAEKSRIPFGRASERDVADAVALCPRLALTVLRPR
ncbi:ferredoxin [Arthrobacter sp. I2-34]|uniref:Ferredoxin n=1 Tax=Arthrobacter hankyongi TaxID=2904801 RepID=A0ABS9LDN6_9MICC|nr:ferredoxin [Arthrobacter hankyongi]MCG2624569.1 ferredoxin [Arthrobacter hankyongi]